MAIGCFASKGKTVFSIEANRIIYGNMLCKGQSSTQMFVIIIVISPTTVATASRTCITAVLKWSAALVLMDHQKPHSK